MGLIKYLNNRGQLAAGNANLLTNPEIVSIGGDEAARALAQQQSAPPANLSPMNLPSYTIPDNPVVPVQAPDPWPVVGTSENPAQPGGLLPMMRQERQPAMGGLLGKLQGQPPAATQSGGLLNFGGLFPNLSPAASQGLLASGLTMLAGNDGSRNLGQLIGVGGLAGLGAYSNSTQEAAANELAKQKMAQEQRQQDRSFDFDKDKFQWERNKPIPLGADQTLYAPDQNQLGAYKPVIQAQPSVATWQETQGPDGMKYRQGFTRTGEPVRDARVLVDNPFAGPLNDFQQKTINDAQLSAQSSVSSLRRAADLANRLQNAPDYVSGLGASFNDWTTKLTGNKDAAQQIRGELTQYVNSYILDNRPPGNLTDADQRYLRQGVPSDSASKETWLGFLNSVSKVRQAVAAKDQASADFVTANRGSLGPLMQPATIGGRTFPAGTSLAQVTDAIWNGAGQAAQPGRAGNARSILGDAARAALARRKGGR